MNDQPGSPTAAEVPALSASFPQCHPDRLATLATLFGMKPAPPEHCRVLEIGCASGGNLIPLAEALTGVGACHHAAGRPGPALISLTEALAIARDEAPLAVHRAGEAADINRRTGRIIDAERTDQALARALRSQSRDPRITGLRH